jgi:hypothetical protein
MAGTIISAVRKRLYDFSGVASGTTQEIIVADQIDLLQWTQVAFLLQVHSSNTFNGTMNVVIFGQSLSMDDPGLDFVDRSLSVSKLIDGTVSAKTYFVIPYLDTVPPMARVVIQGNKTSVGALLNATISLQVRAQN